MDVSVCVCVYGCVCVCMGVVVLVGYFFLTLLYQNMSHVDCCIVTFTLRSCSRLFIVLPTTAFRFSFALLLVSTIAVVLLLRLFLPKMKSKKVLGRCLFLLSYEMLAPSVDRWRCTLRVFANVFVGFSFG